MVKYTREDTILAAKKAFAELPEDINYLESVRRIDTKDARTHVGHLNSEIRVGCFYQIDKQPACLVGHVLHHLGLLENVNEHTGVLSQEVVSNNFDDDAADLMADWQSRQDDDRHRSWFDILYETC